jgi:hypothetical protein
MEGPPTQEASVIDQWQWQAGAIHWAVYQRQAVDARCVLRGFLGRRAFLFPRHVSHSSCVNSEHFPRCRRLPHHRSPPNDITAPTWNPSILVVEALRASMCCDKEIGCSPLALTPMQADLRCTPPASREWLAACSTSSAMQTPTNKRGSRLRSPRDHRDLNRLRIAHDRHALTFLMWQHSHVVNTGRVSSRTADCRLTYTVTPAPPQLVQS